MTLLEPAVERIAPAAGDPVEDRAPDWVADGTPEPLRSDLIALVGPAQVRSRALDLIGYASDSSPYRLIPQAVVMARDADDVAAVLAYGARSGIPVTLRAGGTSLNGQAQGAGILLDVRRHFRGIRIEDGGARARVRPGTVLGHVNRALARHGRRLGPDPASTEAACVGGVIANNSGGMRCGTTADSYSTLRSLTFVLPSGTVIDTAAPGAAERFTAAEPELAAGLTRIRDEIRADTELAERIRRKFSIKNTMGYRLCAFLDADEPVEIFRRLLVGSEGTLGFVAEAVFETVPRPARTTVAWVHFADIDAAVAPVPALKSAGATAVELMVAPALIAAAYSDPRLPEHWRELPPDSAVLLLEYGADDEAGLDAQVEAAAAQLAELDESARPILDPEFVRDLDTVELFWAVREGMQGIVGRLRPPGSAFIIEDVCVAPERIADAARDLRELLGAHGFMPGVAGHASAGNLHFMLTPAFDQPDDRERYEAFMEGLVELIVDRYDGSLKAEHGTGLNMAPYLEREWGPRAVELMWQIKGLADPDGVLAPGVLLSRDPGAHLRNLKTTPPIEEEATTCVECGFCEPVCPSRDLTTTPRQRIVVRREMVRQPSGSPVQRALVEQFEYDGLETCAADGTCALVCPVGIDTGKLVKRLRAAEHSPRTERVAAEAARRYGAVERAARAGLAAGAAVRRVAGDRPLGTLTSAGRRVVSSERLPAWVDGMPGPAPGLPATSRAAAAAVYLPACVNRIFGDHGADGSVHALVAVSARAGRALWIPDDVAGHCCGVPWSSKGHRAGHAAMAARTAQALERWTDGGRLPVVIDASSCAHGVTEDVVGLIEESRRPRVLDAVAWAHDELLGRLEIRRRVARVVVHPTCSAHHLGLTGRLRALAAALADEVVVPRATACCGMAGDRGFLHPELTAAACAPIADELAGERFDDALSSNRTCEIALERATGLGYRSFALALEEATR